MSDVDSIVSIGEVLSLAMLADLLHRRGEASFRKAHPHPFLVLVSLPPTDLEWIDPSTVEEPLEEVVANAGKIRKEFAVAVRKTDRNAYANKVTVGRAKNNDIVLRAPKISKLHAAFTLDDPAGNGLMDMESINGTFLNGLKLEPRKARPVQNGDRVDFWRFGFEYLTLPEMLKLLAKWH